MNKDLNDVVEYMQTLNSLEKYTESEAIEEVSHVFYRAGKDLYW